MQIEREPVEISRIARIYFLKPNTLEKQYKNHLSDFREFEVQKEKELKEEAFVFPENFGEHMAIDETGLIDGELYTILLNKEAKGRKGAIAGFFKGTKSSVIVNAIYEHMGIEELKKTKEITLDLANNMEWIAMQIFPQALRTYDRFHVQKLVTEAVQSVRIKLRWKALEEENEAVLEAKKNKQKYSSPVYSNGDTKKQLLARSRYFLYKPSSKWYKSQEQRSQILFKEFPELKHAYNLSMYFRNCYEKPQIHSFNDWISKAQKSDIKEMRAVSVSIERHLPGITSYFNSKATNANIESFNGKLKLFRSNTRGIKDKNFFLFRILKYFS